MVKQKSVITVLCCSIMLACAVLGRLRGAGQDEHMTAEQLARLIQSEKEEDHDKAILYLCNERQCLFGHLHAIIRPANADKFSNRSRLAASYLLGMMRDPRSAAVLSKALTNPPKRRDMAGDIGWYDSSVTDALIRIGRPAVPEMIKNIRTSDNENVVETSVDVLWHVLGGKRHTLELIDKLIARETDEQVKKRLANARKIAEARQEKEEPLY